MEFLKFLLKKDNRHNRISIIMYFTYSVSTNFLFICNLYVNVFLVYYAIFEIVRIFDRIILLWLKVICYSINVIIYITYICNVCYVYNIYINVYIYRRWYEYWEMVSFLNFAILVSDMKRKKKFIINFNKLNN